MPPNMLFLGHFVKYIIGDIILDDYGRNMILVDYAIAYPEEAA